MKLHRTPEQWSKMEPRYVLAGSKAQCLSVMTMLRDDIVMLGAELERFNKLAERAETVTPAENVTLRKRPVAFRVPDGPKSWTMLQSEDAARDESVRE